MKKTFLGLSVSFIFFSCQNPLPSTDTVKEEIINTINVKSNNEVELLEFLAKDGVDTIFNDEKFYKVKFNGKIRYKRKGYANTAGFTANTQDNSFLKVFNEKSPFNKTLVPVDEQTTKEIIGHIFYYPNKNGWDVKKLHFGIKK